MTFDLEKAQKNKLNYLTFQYETELKTEIERLRAKVRKMEFLMRSTEDTCLACAIKLEVIDQQAARIKELEAVLKEADQYRRESLDRIMQIAKQRDDLEILNESLMENGNDLRQRAQKAEARINELEATVSALREIAEAERAKRILDDDPEKKFDFVGLTECPSHNEYCDDNCYLERCPSERFWRSVARRQLSEEHPEAFR